MIIDLIYISVPHQSPGYKCECIQGYVQDPHDSSQCKAREGHPSLLFAHKSDVRKLSLDRPSMTAIVNNTRWEQAFAKKSESTTENREQNNCQISIRVFDIQIFYFVKSYIYNDVSKCSQQWDVLRHYITIILSDLLVLSIFILRQEWFFGLMSEKRKSTSKKYLILNGVEVNNVLWFNKMLADSPVTCKLGSSIIQPSHYCFKTIN